MYLSSLVAMPLVGFVMLGTPHPAEAQGQGPAPGGLAFGTAGSRIGASVREPRSADLAVAKLTKPEGVVVESVEAAGPAQRSGMRAGDILLEYDGERIRSTRQFSRLVLESAAGREVPLVVNRGGTRHTLRVTPEEGGTASISLGRLRDRFERHLPELSLGLGQRTAERRTGLRLTALSSQLASYFGATGGALVSSVLADSPASRAAIKAGDVITAIDGRTVGTPADVVARLRDDRVLELVLMRDKHEMRVQLRLDDTDDRRRARDPIGI